MGRTIWKLIFIANVVVVAGAYRLFGANYFEVRENSILIALIALAATFLENFLWDRFRPDPDSTVRARNNRITLGALGLTLAAIVATAFYLHSDRLSNDARQQEQDAEDLRTHQENERLKPGFEALEKFSQQHTTTAP